MNNEVYVKSDLLIEKREKKDFSQKGLAQKSGVSRSSIQNMEGSVGSTRRFQIALIKKVATALDLEPEDLIDETPLERHRDQMGPQTYPDLSPLKSPDNYVEREWLDQEFDYFLSGLESDEGGLFVVEGHPGDGKTYWLQHLVHHRHLHLAHFFSSGSGITSQEQLIGSMTEQADSLDMCESSPHRGDTLAIFLGQLNPRNRIIIALDALDEADQDDASRGSVAFLPDSAVDNIIIVATTTPNATLPQWYQRQRVQLRGRHECENDLRNYAKQLIPKADASFVNEAISVCQGNFLYARHLFLEARDTGFSKYRLDRLPNGIVEYYDQHWAHMVKHADDFSSHEMVLKQIVMSSEPMSEAHLNKSTGLGSIAVRQIVERWRHYLHCWADDEGRRSYEIYHPTFRNFLIDVCGVGMK